MAKTITLTGRLADVTSIALGEVTRVTVKAPSYRPGPGIELTTSAPQNVDLGADGAITINVTEGVGWIYLDGPGWTDSIRFVAAEGMTTIWEAVVNALPIVVEAKRLLVELGRSYEDARSDLLRTAKQTAADADAQAAAAIKRVKDSGYEITRDIESLAREATASVKKDREAVEAHVQALAAPNDAAVLGLVTDGADTATRKALDSAFIRKQRGETRYVYVREEGDDTTGDGSYYSPFRQIQPALDSIIDGPVIPGSVIIDVGSGTFKGNVRIPNARARAQDDFIKIVGRAGSNGVPNTIVDTPSGAGVLAEDGAALWLENIKFVGAFSIAVQITRNVYGWFNNVHVDGEGQGVRGFSISQHCRYYVKGGLIENCAYAGIDEYFNVARSYATVSKSEDQMLISKCKIGIRVKEGCIGHLDYLRVEDCGTGIELLQNCVANLKGVTLKRNTTGLALTNSTSHNEGGIVWGDGGDANQREVWSAGMSGELRALMWSGEDMAEGSSAGHRPLMALSNDFTERIVTGEAGKTVVVQSFPQSIPRAFFRTVGKHFKSSLLASFYNASESNPVKVNLRAGSVLLGTATVQETGLQEVCFDTVCVEDRTTHMTRSWVVGSKSAGMQASRTSTAFGGNASGIASLTIETTFSASGQKIQVQSSELFG